jgi:hypothetical protein
VAVAVEVVEILLELVLAVAVVAVSHSVGQLRQRVVSLVLAELVVLV